MIQTNAELLQYVLDDIQKYDGFRHFAKASVLERLLIKKQPPQMLHPNPNDEFTHPNVGPHYGILNEYCSRFRSTIMPIEPLVVEKMEQGGYMILNGHHRWAAALKLGLKTIPVQIVNLAHEEDFRKMLARTNNTKRVIFDFDEVLCVTDPQQKAEVTPHLLFGSFENIYEERLRWGAPVLIHELQQQEYDVWVYSSKFHSIDYFQSFFKAYHLKIDGIINGAGRKKSKKAEQDYREMVAKKYKLIYNIDNKGVLRIRPAEQDFEIFDIEHSDRDWANKVMDVIKKTSEE